MLGLVVALLALNSVLAQLTWQLVKPESSLADTPIARRDAGLGYDPVRNRLVLFGGQSDSSGAKYILGDTWIFDFSNSKKHSRLSKVLEANFQCKLLQRLSGTWREVRKSVNPSPRYKFVYGVSNDNFYIATGLDGNYQYMDDIWQFNLK